jgi:hypothetical protein
VCHDFHWHSAPSVQGQPCRNAVQGGADVLDHPKGWSLLHLAAAMGHDSCVNYLLGCNVPVDGAFFSSDSPVSTLIKTATSLLSNNVHN